MLTTDVGSEDSRLRGRTAVAVVGLMLLLSACAEEPTGSAPQAAGTSNEATAQSAGDIYSDAEAACELISKDMVLGVFTFESASRWVSDDESTCLYGSISPVGIEVITITVAIPQDDDPFGVVQECAALTWGEENLIALDDLASGAFGVALPNGGALVHSMANEVILTIGMQSSFQSAEDSFEVLTELAFVARDSVEAAGVALGDGRNWPPPGCGG